MPKLLLVIQLSVPVPLPNLVMIILNHGRNYDLKIFSTAVLTLNFDLDLSKVNSELGHKC